MLFRRNLATAQRSWSIVWIGIALLCWSASDGVSLGQEAGPKGTKRPPNRTLEDLVQPKSGAKQTPWVDPRWPVPRVDEPRWAAMGIRKLSGRHLVLYTDVRDTPEVDELPQVFDAAVPQWCAYFGVEPGSLAGWRMVGYVMADREKFRGAGILRANLPPFLNGFQLQGEFWLYDQPSHYYRRHLFLHEGTHAFMNWRLGGCGPPWYMEGMAEYLSTHAWRDGKLKLAYMPRSNEEVPEWGRMKIIRDDVAAGRGLTLAQIFRYDETAHLRVEPYGWSWAACTFFENHPRWQPAFRELRARVADRSIGFSQQFHDQLNADWLAIQREWRCYVSELDYGYDVRRNAIEPKEPHSLAPQGESVSVSADRGWQSTGIELQAGGKYRISAKGRFRLGETSKVWWSEPNGVTIRFHRGLPLGMLLGGLVDERAAEAETLVSPSPIGLQRDIAPARSGVLYLKLNDSPAERADNGGSVEVMVAPTE